MATRYRFTDCKTIERKKLKKRDKERERERKRKYISNEKSIEN